MPAVRLARAERERMLRTIRRWPAEDRLWLALQLNKESTEEPRDQPIKDALLERQHAALRDLRTGRDDLVRQGLMNEDEEVEWRVYDRFAARELGLMRSR